MLTCIWINSIRVNLAYQIILLFVLAQSDFWKNVIIFIELSIFQNNETG